MYKYTTATPMVSTFDKDLITTLSSTPNHSITMTHEYILAMRQTILLSIIHRPTTMEHMEYGLLTDQRETP